MLSAPAMSNPVGRPVSTPSGPATVILPLFGPENVEHRQHVAARIDGVQDRAGRGVVVVVRVAGGHNAWIHAVRGVAQRGIDGRDAVVDVDAEVLVVVTVHAEPVRNRVEADPERRAGEEHRRTRGGREETPTSPDRSLD